MAMCTFTLIVMVFFFLIGSFSKDIPTKILCVIAGLALGAALVIYRMPNEFNNIRGRAVEKMPKAGEYSIVMINEKERKVLVTEIINGQKSQRFYALSALTKFHEINKAENDKAKNPKENTLVIKKDRDLTTADVYWSE